MECHLCQTSRSRAQWAPSQWKNSDPSFDGLIGCKQCRELPARLNGTVEAAVCAIWRCILFSGAAQQVLAEFIEAYMAKVPSRTRKALSHLGALHSFPGSPKHWVDDDDDHSASFDPGNDVYFWAMKLLFPEADFMVECNRETIGDVCEGLLAFRFRKIHDCSFAVVDFVEVLCSAVWVVCAHMRIHTFEQLSSVLHAARKF
jgi:hypothetical protein